MIYRIRLTTDLEMYPKNFLLTAHSPQQVTRIIVGYLGVEGPFEILGTITRIEAPYNKYEVLGLEFILQIKKDYWVLMEKPTSYEFGKHLTFINNEYRVYET